MLNYLQLERAKVVSFAVFVVGWTWVRFLIIFSFSFRVRVLAFHSSHASFPCSALESCNFVPFSLYYPYLLPNQNSFSAYWRFFSADTSATTSPFASCGRCNTSSIWCRACFLSCSLVHFHSLGAFFIVFACFLSFFPGLLWMNPFLDGRSFRDGRSFYSLVRSRWRRTFFLSFFPHSFFRSFLDGLGSSRDPHYLSLLLPFLLSLSRTNPHYYYYYYYLPFFLHPSLPPIHAR